MISTADSLRVSVASIWEIALKHSIGKMDAPEPVVEALGSARTPLVDIAVEHAVAVSRSPLPHNDPFDRLITAQAQVQGWTLFTADSRILSAGLAFTTNART